MYTHYFLQGEDNQEQDDEHQGKFLIGPLIENRPKIPNQYSGSIIRSNEYSSYYDPEQILSFDLYYLKTNQSQVNKYDIINSKYELTHINKFTGILDENERLLHFELNNNHYRLIFNIKEEPETRKKLIMHPHLVIEFNN